MQDGFYPFPPAGGGGEANTSSNAGTGIGLAKPKSGVDLPFKSLLKDVVDGTDEVTIPYRFLSENATGTDTYAVTTGLPLVIGDLGGMNFAISFANANTGPATLAIDSIGAIPIVKDGGTALAASDLQANRYYILTYDGANFQVANVVAGGGGESNTTSNSGSGTGLALPKSGVDLPFKSLKALKDLDISNDATSVTYTAPYRYLSGVSTGSVNAYTLTTGSSVIEADLQGMLFAVNFSITNTGPSTLNVDGIGIKNIVKGGTTALEANDLITGKLYLLGYNGTNFEVINIVPDFTGSAVSGGSACFDINDINFDQITFAEVTTYASLCLENSGTNLDATNNQCTAMYFRTRDGGSSVDHYGAIVYRDDNYVSDSDLDRMYFGLTDRTLTTSLYYPMWIQQSDNKTISNPASWGGLHLSSSAYITNSFSNIAGFIYNNCERYGYRARANGQASVFGWEASAGAFGTTMGFEAGKNNAAGGDGSQNTLFGYRANYNGTYSGTLAMGYLATSTGTNPTAAGNSSYAGSQACAFGYNSTAATNSIVVGSTSTTGGIAAGYGVLIGSFSSLNSKSGVVIVGSTLSSGAVTGNEGVGIGIRIHTLGYRAIAIGASIGGNGTRAGGDYAIALGYQAIANGNNGGAFGQLTVGGTDGWVFGRSSSVASGTNTFAFGIGCLSEDNAFSIGGTTAITHMYLGKGSRNAGFPAGFGQDLGTGTFTISASQSYAGTGVSYARGWNLRLQPGRGVGNYQGSGVADPGKLIFTTPDYAGAAVTNGTYIDRCEVWTDGAFVFYNQSTVETNYRKIQKWQAVGGGYLNLYTANANEPEGNLTAEQAGDLCVSPDGLYRATTASDTKWQKLAGGLNIEGSAGSGTASENADVYKITGTGGGTITLPDAATFRSKDGFLVLKDAGGNAGISSILTAAAGSDTIEATISITTNYGSQRVFPDGTVWRSA